MYVENINHIHYFTTDFEKTSRVMKVILGREPNFFHDYTQEAGVIVNFWNFPHGFQIMGVSDKNKSWGAYATESAKNEIQTLSCQVKSIDACIPEMEAMGFAPIHDTDAANGGVREVNFDAAGTFGFNIELMEYRNAFNEE